ncbi:2-dehydro-3-deoxyphosphooctonate aldolase [Alphaproteobacteria bacterium]|nr:2-dehydro-3-deoxyphosphooctonate aldolase [Alphaproteobacteria bacterium]
MAAVVKVGPVEFGNKLPLALIAGPCQIESAAHAKFMAAEVQKIAARLNMPFVFKASFDKANRTSGKAPRGVGLEAGLRVLADIKESLGLPILTDVHEPAQCAAVAEVADILQIPAFLARQTDLIAAASATGRVVNIKKAQFMAPWDMKGAVAKATGGGAKGVLMTERGSCFGYNALVVDMRALPQMAALDWPVVFDATHSVQQPGGRGDSSGGQREFVAPLARAAVAVGVAAVFVETHDRPDEALSDGPNALALQDLEMVLKSLQDIDNVVKMIGRA